MYIDIFCADKTDINLLRQYLLLYSVTIQIILVMFLPHWPKIFETKLGYRHTPVYYDALKVLNRLGNPQHKLQKVIYVTGTNGKGSTVSYISKILSLAGYTVNSCLSPHAFHCNERIVLNGSMIYDDFLTTLLEKCRIASESENITLGFASAFSIVTLMAFAEKPADFCVLEGTIGGRFDPLNVCQNGISVFTAIDVDHVEYLGHTAAKGAMEKAFVMRDNSYCVIAKQKHEEVDRVLRIVAEDVFGCEVFHSPWEWSCVPLDDNASIEFNFQNNRYIYERPLLRGNHQVDNAGAAIAAAKCVSMLWGAKIPDQSISQGLAQAFIALRLQSVHSPAISSLFPDGSEIFIDGGHNRSGMEALKEWAVDIANGRDAYVIFGTSKGKNVHSMYGEIRQFAKMCCCVNVVNEPRAMPAAELYSACKEDDNINHEELDYRITLEDGLNLLAEKLRGRGAAIILICGSIYLGRDLNVLSRCVLA